MAQAQLDVNMGVKVIDIIKDKMSSKENFFSFEYYPPKTEKGVESLKKRLHTMDSWGPQWMDVTWGAGGTTADLTPEICDYIQNNVKGNCMMHLTCTNMQKEKIDIALEKAQKMGLKNILALRGDPPEGQKEWKAGDSAFTCALDLIKYIKSKYKDYFGITISGYPEGHPLVRKKIKLSCDNWDSKNNKPFYWAPRIDEDGDWEGVSKEDWEKELNYLKQKVEAGGQVIITQLFYDCKVFIDFVKEVRKIGVNVPILPGIMPIRNLKSFQRMTSFCRTVIPNDLQLKLTELKDNNKELVLYGLKYISSMLSEIQKANIVPGFHFYTMNLEYSVIAMLQMLKYGDLKVIDTEYQRLHTKQLDKWTQAEKAALNDKILHNLGNKQNANANANANANEADANAKGSDSQSKENKDKNWKEVGTF